MSTSASAAPTKQQCIDANAEAQSLRAAGKFAATREQLRQCIDAACPGAVRDDCTQRLDELEQHQPTVVLAARDGRGDDLVAVSVTVDGTKLLDRLDGRAIPLDPGDHTLVFESEGFTPLTKHLVMHEGERSRSDTIKLEHISEGPRAVDEVPKPVTPAATEGGMSGQKIGAFVAGGAGVVGLGLGVALFAMSSSAWSRAQTECASTASCTDRAAAQSDHDSAASLATGSTVAVIVGAALVATGVVLFFTDSPKKTVGLSPRVAPGSAGLVLGGAF